MPYPEQALGFRVEIAPGADLATDPSTYSWTDVTSSWWQRDGIKIKRGCEDEQGVGSTSLELSFRNNDGAFSLDNASSPHWPGWDVGCPIRVSVDPRDGSGWNQRCVCYLGEVTLDWPAGTPHLCIAKIRADGLFVRLGTGKILRSPLERAITADAPAYYWPMTEGAEATQFNALVGGTPLALTGVPEMSSIEGSLGAPSNLPQFINDDSDDYLGHGSVVVSDISDTNWCIEFIVRATTDAGPWPDSAIASVASVKFANGNTDDVNIDISYTFATGGYGVTIKWSDESSTGIGTVTTRPLWNGEWHYLCIGFRQLDASNIRVYLYGDDDGLDWSDHAGVFGDPVSVVIPNLTVFWPPTKVTSLSYGHVAIHSGVYVPPGVADRYAAMNGWIGETVDERIDRLCTEEGVTADIIGTSNVTMGPQSSARLLDLLRECEKTDHGILDDSHGVVGYRCRSNLYNQAAALTIDADARQLALPFTPSRDDQKLYNVVSVSRPGGGSAIAEDAASIARHGRREAPNTEINVDSDEVLEQHAGWLVNIWSTLRTRYPELSVDLLVSPTLITDFLAMLLGDRIDVTNPPRWHTQSAIEQQARGWTETYAGNRRGWLVTANTVSVDPYRVAVIEPSSGEPPLRFDLNGQTLVADFDIGVDTTFQIATASGYPLVTTTATYPADFPFDLNVAGAQVRVTAIVGAASPQTVTCQAVAVNGVVKTAPAGTVLTLWRPAVLAL